MTLRTFNDRDGVTWNVWLVVPNGGGAGYPERYRDGWVCFERLGGGQRCRIPLAEMPANWESLTDDRLDLLRRVAETSSSTGSMARVPADEPSGETAARINAAREDRGVN